MLPWSASSVNLSILLFLDVCLFPKNKCHHFTVHNISCASFIFTLVLSPTVNNKPCTFWKGNIKYCTLYKTIAIIPYSDCWLPLGHITAVHGTIFHVLGSYLLQSLALLWTWTYWFSQRCINFFTSCENLNVIILCHIQIMGFSDIFDLLPGSENDICKMAAILFRGK